MGGSQSQRWAAAGPGSGDIAYRTQNLKYQPIEISLDETVSATTLFRLWLRAFIAWVAIQFVFWTLWVLVLLGSDWSSGDVPGDGVLAAGSVLAFIAFWLVLLMSQIDEPIAEWKTLLEGQAGAASSAYAAVYGSLGRRQIPVLANALRIRSDVLAPEVVNSRLVISERSYTAYVSVFPYGTSLYAGWMMWRSRRGYTLIGHFAKDLVGGMLGRTGSINQMLRTERIRAMREAVHSAVREGVEVAVQGIEVPMAATFGQDVPIQDLRAGVAMAPAAPAGPGFNAPTPAAPVPAPPAAPPADSGGTDPNRPRPAVGG